MSDDTPVGEYLLVFFSCTKACLLDGLRAAAAAYWAAWHAQDHEVISKPQRRGTQSLAMLTKLS
jgi:hypothetical protein